MLTDFETSTQTKLKKVREAVHPMEDLYSHAKKLDVKKDLKEYFGFHAVLSRQISKLVPRQVAVVDEQRGSAANYDGEEMPDSITMPPRHRRHGLSGSRLSSLRGGRNTSPNQNRAGLGAASDVNTQYAAFLDQFETGRNVLKQHQKFGQECNERMESMVTKLTAVWHAGLYLCTYVPCWISVLLHFVLPPVLSTHTRMVMVDRGFEV